MIGFVGFGVGLVVFSVVFAGIGSLTFWLGVVVLAATALHWIFETRPVPHRAASLSLLGRDDERIGWERERIVARKSEEPAA